MFDDKEFDRNVKAHQKTMTRMLYFSGVVLLGVLVAIGFVVYKILHHFSIM